MSERIHLNTLFALATTTVIASICTGPAAAYHFNRIAPYGLIGNLLALPVISAIVMPAALIGTLLMLLGLEQPVFQLMERGLEAVMIISDWTAALPGAKWIVPRHGPESALLMAGGILWVSLILGPARWLGLAAFALGMALTMWAEHPDVIIERTGLAGAPIHVPRADRFEVARFQKIGCERRRNSPLKA
jgi:competence protein ComEC